MTTQTPDTAFAAVLAEAVDLLRTLSRRRPDVPGARRAVERWRAANPGTRAQLVADVRPGSPIVDYDLVLSHPGGGTVALTAPADDGVPWTVDHSTHWASGRLLTVNDQELLIQNALLTLRAREQTIQEELVEHCILTELAARETEPTQSELQEASDAFRLQRGLRGRAQTLRWLENVGLTPSAYDNHIHGLALRRRLRQRVEHETARDYLERHPSEFDHVWAVWAVGPKDRLTAVAVQDDPLTALAHVLLSPPPSPGGGGGDDLTVTTAHRAAREMPEPFRDAAAGAVVGPVPHGEDHLFGIVRGRRPADPEDPGTLAAAGRAGFAAFMAEQRAKAEITWYWL
ncbi:TIGR04500 family putative peptide maturation system protein [Planotetraspora sp. A-T 1434]|uniref:TIGR04500 family putative peptide maturation system protein n=1 Tax=Planotetraspora sp. A-T 1434 TaxID=2979219 RepID=UPI0021BE0BD9|nr:TIGR04500 family putative peptide maturation system protein [Planotetraspora sp. A-T 1434]MCT9933776.1 TIGR04500 family putative peptide maturation system protein [Planotetraspora sp. A-T 1434]